MYVRGSRQTTPILTATACAVCVALFLAVNAGSRQIHEWILAGDAAIYEGAYWRLVFSAFVHMEPIHLIFNLYWLWVLGGALERTVGSGRWLIFVACSAFISSGLQLASGDSGIGMSGVGYALFGFGWLTSRRYPEFARLVSRQTVKLFIGWGLLCVFLTYFHIWNIGNFAHFAGFAFGAAVGGAIALEHDRKTFIATAVLLAGASIVPLFYNPLSLDWVATKAYRLAVQRRYAEAIPYFRRSLQMGGDPEWAWRSLARSYRLLGQSDEYRDAVRKLKAIDPDAAAEIVDAYGDPETPEERSNAHAPAAGDKKEQPTSDNQSSP